MDQYIFHYRDTENENAPSKIMIIAYGSFDSVYKEWTGAFPNKIVFKIDRIPS